MLGGMKRVLAPLPIPKRVAPADRLEQIRALRRGLPQGKFLPGDIDAFKRRGRA
jgi:hypothetical protein